MITPVRMRLSRKKDFRLQSESLELNGLHCFNGARPGRFGNPFFGPDMCSKDAATHYRAQIMRLGFVVNTHGKTITREYIVKRCAGLNGACHCRVESPWCHVDTILQIANGWDLPPPWSGFAKELAEIAEASNGD